MAVLAEISVAIADLKAIRPDILNFQYDTESDDFAEEITRAKQTLYRQVKDQERLESPTLTEADLTARLLLVKEIEDVGYLKERLVLLCLAEIFKANDMFDHYNLYSQDAENIPLKYHVDVDDDDTITDDEKRTVAGGAIFGR